MAAEAVQATEQLPLNRGWIASPPRARHETMLCAGCREREARYGFRAEDDGPDAERPRTLCFQCFRVELLYRQMVRERLARGWNAQQVTLPLSQTLDALRRRRGRAQIAARRALELR